MPIARLITYFGNFVFGFFRHFSCVIFLMLLFRLAHFTMQNVNKDYVIFSYFSNFVTKPDERKGMKQT